jgi:hypothetical protein
MANGAGLKIPDVRVHSLRWFGHPVQKWFKGSNPFPRIKLYIYLRRIKRGY